MNSNSVAMVSIYPSDSYAINPDIKAFIIGDYGYLYSGRSIVIDSNGSIIFEVAAGGSSIWGNGHNLFTGGGSQGAGALLSNYSITSGNLDWSLNIPSRFAYATGISSIRTDSSGNIYAEITSYFNTQVVKVSPSGEIIWTKDVANGEVWGSTGGDLLITSNAIYATGVASEFHSDGSTFDNYVAKLDSNGNRVWVTTIADQNYRITDIKELANGNIVTLSAQHQSDPHGLIKVINPSTGAIVFSKSFYINDLHVMPYSCAIDIDGNIVVQGIIYPGNGDQDIFIAKFSATDGSLIWSDALTVPGYDLSQGLSIDANGVMTIMAAGTGPTQILGNTIDNEGAFVYKLQYIHSSGAITGTDVNDIVQGSAGADTIQTNAGNDTVNAGAGSDLIIGGDGLGDDTYNGGEGLDTVKYTSALAAITVNLLLGSATSSAGGDAAKIGFDTLSNIENIIAGDFADTLTGSDLNNAITGESGNDTINGGLGTDTAIYQGTKNQYTIFNNNNGTWTITDSVLGRDGMDTISNIEYLQFTDETYALTGGGGGTSGLVLLGTQNIDTLNGGSGNDIITGLAKVDILNGQEGSDLYIMTSSSDHTAAEIKDTGSGGIDEVRFTTLTASTLTLYAGDTGIERVTIGTGTAATAITTGTTQNNINASQVLNALTIIGNAGNNILTGTLGYNDTLIGGLGNDTYVVNNAGDVVTEALNAGIDLIQSTISFSVSDHVENLTLTGSTNINATGNSLNNTLRGNTNNNILDGGLGNDTMIGGLGNDTYIVDSTSDIVTEGSNAGTDSIQSSVTYTASNNVEHLTLTGSSNINATGNTLANILTGNSGNNILNGSSGNDTLTGGLGNDTFVFNTALNATSNRDTITDFSHGDDTIQLSKSVMSALGALGTLSANDFKLSTQTLDTSDRIIYNPTTGGLFYDADGSGSRAPLQMALIGTTTHPSDVDYTDFIIVV